MNNPPIPTHKKYSPALVLAGAAWLLVALVSYIWPNGDDFPHTRAFVAVCIAVGLAALVMAWVPRFYRRGPWLLALAITFGLWEIVQAKLLLLPRPFFGTPQDLVDVFLTDWRRLGDSLYHSLRLMAVGYCLGTVLGFLAGVGLGWSRWFGYWVHPVLRLVGPLPPVALLPIAFAVMPSGWLAGEALIALASGFPVAVLTWSGIAAVDTAYYDVARTLGARSLFMVLRIAIPAALPSVFVGMFMGLGACFSVLVVAEMLGVKSGLGFYMQWAQGWAAYPNMYAALIVMALMCTGLMTLLFRIRDRVLVWQKGGLKW